MPDKKFLEEFPLYKKLEMQVPANLLDVPRPSINVHCGVCQSIQTFKMQNYYGILPHTLINVPVDSAGKIVEARYLCSSCEKYEHVFLLKFDDEGSFVKKAGQFPPWEISIGKDLAKVLGEHRQEYQRGLICESQGFGIGAFAYYRRIVESIIDNFLQELDKIIDDKEKERYKKALEETRKTKCASDKIALVKDLLPSSLRPEGMNPLGILHDQLSKGIHGERDEECLHFAGVMRNAIEFLVGRILQAGEQSRQFTDGMKKLLDKKRQRTD